MRFLIGGGANTLFSYAMYWVLLPCMPYLWAYTISYVVAILSGFAMNTWFVFRTAWSWKRLFAFPAVHLVNYLAALIVVWIAAKLFGISEVIAPVVATVVILPLNFVLTRRLMIGRM